MSRIARQLVLSLAPLRYCTLGANGVDGARDETKTAGGTISAVTRSAFFGPNRSVRWSGAGNFDKLTSRVNFTAAADINNLEAMTVNCWMYAKSLGENDAGTVAQKGNITTGTGWWLILRDNTGAGGSATSFRFIRNRVTSNVRVDISEGYVTNRWHMITVASDGTTSAAGTTLYLDGKSLTSINTSDGVGDPNADTAEALRFGNNDDTTRTFDGYLAECSIFNTKLSASDIWRMYSAYRRADVPAGRAA